MTQGILMNVKLLLNIGKYLEVNLISQLLSVNVKKVNLRRGE